MRGIVISTELELVTDTCCKCGIVFAVPARFQNERRRDHATFYCPSGHPLHYGAESPEEKLRRDLNRQRQNNAYLEDEAKRQRERAEASERQAAARKGVITRLKKRAAGGVCPCCNRTFSALAQHMKTQHPGFVAEEVT